MRRREACLEMMSQGRAGVGRLVVVVKSGEAEDGTAVSLGPCDWTSSARSGNGSMMPASSCSDSRLSARMMSGDALGGASISVCGGVVTSASASRVVLVDCLDFDLVKAALMLETMVEAFFSAMVDGS